MITLEIIKQALRCDNPSCTCYKPTGHVHCPVHDPARQDKTPSLSITEKDKILVHCFNGCSQEAVIDSMKEKGIWPPRRGINSAGKVCNTATPPGLTLEVLAKAKGLQVDGPKGLKAWGVAEAKQHRATVIRIPYFSADGHEVAVRFRHSLTSPQRFTWRKEDKVHLYGLWRLPESQKTGWTLLVEGETDCWTAWAHDLPALGLPGASTWRTEWAEHLKGMQVFLWAEPDEAGQALPLKIGKDIPGLMVIKAPEGTKDLNEAHIRGEDIPALVERLKAHAVPAASIIRAQADQRLEELREKALRVLEAPDPLVLVREAIICQGYGGDPAPVLLCYLSVTSRLLAMRPGAMPVHLLLLGQASAGKSYLLSMVLRLLPEEAFHVIDAGSPKVLIYDEADLQHRVLVFSEADSLPAGEDNPAASAIRNLLQDHYLHYDVTVKDPATGIFKVIRVRKEGPTMLVTTSTRRLGYQLDTRLFSLHVDDSNEKISAALEAQAEIELNGAPPPNEALIAFQAFLQAHAPWDVTIPFVKPLAALISQRANAPRIMRDFARLLSLVKSVTVLRQAHRKRDAKGKLIATIEDYATVYYLAGPMFETTLTGASKELRETVQAVKEMLDRGEPVTATSLSAKLGINRGTASRRVNAAIRNGWIINWETKKGQPWDLQLGEPIPEQHGLPDPETLECCTDAMDCNKDNATPQHNEVNENIFDCCTVAGTTDDFFLHTGNEDRRNLKEIVI